MFLFYFYSTTLILVMNFNMIMGIVHPNRTNGDKRFMVYLTKAEQSEQAYDNWICGGAIVTPEFILTSAACVKDVQFMYAISGYNKYYKSSSRTFQNDPCISKSKKKIVLTCVPKDYNFTYDKYENWANIDIALAKVESPYDFDKQISPSCAWIPLTIEISYNYKHMEPGTDSIVLGWGSVSTWRNENDTRDHNLEFLQYSPVLIQSKQKCKEFYKELPGLLEVIDKYMICSMGGGNLDDVGRIISKALPIADGCLPDNDNGCQPAPVESYDNSKPQTYAYINHQERKSMSGSGPINDYNSIYTSYSYTFKHTTLKDKNNQSRSEKNFQNEDNMVNISPLVNIATRRHGFCQNDHGGPLITWVGGKVILIGVASVFMLRNDTCVGPYLYTSTNCNGAFLGCILKTAQNEFGLRYRDEDGEPRAYNANVPEWFNPAICNMSPKKRGFDIERRTISWIGHPDGPAANELEPEEFFERPQIPLYNISP